MNAEMYQLVINEVSGPFIASQANPPSMQPYTLTPITEEGITPLGETITPGSDHMSPSKQYPHLILF